MKSKIFKIHLADETRNFEELKLNKFLESVFVRQTFAAVVNHEYWSIIVFYEDSAPLQTENVIVSLPAPQTRTTAPVPATIKPPETEKPTPEPLTLTPEREDIFNALKQWRNERANQDGLPPYMIAPNDSLMHLAAADIQTEADLIGIKGFGEKRAQKYGAEILEILNLKR
jgi:superfamily II DNA helicase RecQ